ncbi:chemotaxis protein CheC [Hydrogenoanaerobacterium saccharovorans]|uniref:Chemotaxis protein CheC n=1 Tax=Hydrogenoanaerobacterium saccharovorans TaxID=474960 RepID=A0A1H7ZT17_9FIRM|nr:chemotaxis protein CheC [Hydrogenoanaerobacterium saccharovorans]RPF48410.1 chemotaxis protein CheC [Hydrogenoanaerobacterium saccharovorans]SEM61406.1 chemotaxis protein CheC [Hydrogenoanaerobacterium saccharovorans]
MQENIYKNLGAAQIDVLAEIGNIGSGNAATALSTMLNTSISIQTPTVKIMDINKAADMLGGPENVVVGILSVMQGDVEGMMLFLLESEFACKTLNVLLGSDYKDFNSIDEMGQSALIEIANIMAYSYANALAALTDFFISLTVPSMCYDMLGAVLSEPSIVFAEVGDQLMFIKGDMNVAGENMKSHMLMIPEAKSLQKIMEKLGVQG